MVLDYALNENFEVYIDPTGDLATVTGRDAFEQDVLVRITDKYFDLIGEVDDDFVVDQVELSTERVAKEHDRLDEVAAMSAEFSDDKPNTLVVEIIYDTGEPLTFEVEG